jgi:hypothetical protein
MTEEVRLVFKQPDRLEAQALGLTDAPETLVAKVEDIEHWFKHFKIDSIEIWIEAAAKAGQVVSLLVSAEGKGGIKVTLKPASKRK